MPRPTTRLVSTNGITLHVTECGEGPPVVFCHGFPHTGYIWHRQLPAVAAAGFRAVAPDMRGYGGSDRPEAVADYTNAKAVGDLVGLLDEMGEEQAVFVGLDFGAALTWELALRAPERVRAVIVCNNPYIGRGRRRPSEVFARMAEQHFLHIHYFQEPGPADKELDADPRRFLSSIYFALSGGFHYLDIWAHPSAGNGYLDVLPVAPPLPWAWLTTAELDVLAGHFARTGFTGGLNWYRAMDLNWELMEPLADATVNAPAFFIYGEKDCDMEGFSGMDPIAAMRNRVPDLREVTEIPGAGHLVQLEATEQVNALIVRHLRSLGG
ncbi:MAG TPA: alpha/beta hydrolase [Acidimicrobiales bacterium]|nr:alpha/beta hydrolase [Acidimicrobiales bacterium]